MKPNKTSITGVHINDFLVAQSVGSVFFGSAVGKRSAGWFTLSENHKSWVSCNGHMSTIVAIADIPKCQESFQIKLS